MSLRDKAAKINFDDLDDEAVQSRDAKDDVPVSGTAVGSGSAGPDASAAAVPPRPRTGVAAISERITLHHQVQELQTQLATFQQAQLVTKLDPRRVRQSKWKNRHELSFLTHAYAELKSEIEAAGGNVQPIKVRRAGIGADGADEYEIVYGRRRLRACLELGLEVNSIVEDMDDVQLYKEMERENRNRADLSPWEQGVMYKDALDAKLFSSQRQMAAALNVPQSNLSMALALASLPEEIIQAFASPLELQYRWATVLSAALDKDTARVITTASELAKQAPRPSAKEVLARLVSSDARKVQSEDRQLRAGGKVIGSLRRDLNGTVTLRLRAGVLNATDEKKLTDFVEHLLG